MTMNILGGALGIMSNMGPSNVRALLLNVNSPETRGTAFALYNLSDDGKVPFHSCLFLFFYCS